MIPIPDRLKKFPLWHGFPVFFTVTVEPDGTPRFTVLARAKQVEAAKNNLCHICGEKMTPMYYFIGVQEEINSRVFHDGPMHKECAYYAAQACPFLSNPNAVYKGNATSTNQVYQAMMQEANKTLGTQRQRPARMCIAATTKYTYDIRGQYPVFFAGKWIKKDWTAITPRNETLMKKKMKAVRKDVGKPAEVVNEVLDYAYWQKVVGVEGGSMVQLQQIGGTEKAAIYVVMNEEGGEELLNLPHNAASYVGNILIIKRDDVKDKALSMDDEDIRKAMAFLEKFKDIKRPKGNNWQVVTDKGVAFVLAMHEEQNAANFKTWASL